MARLDMPLDELRAYRPAVAEPSDVDDFWDRTLAEARAHSGNVTATPTQTALSNVVVRDVRFPGFNGDSIAAWLIAPAVETKIRGAIVQYVGYGGGRGLPHQHLTWASAGYAHLVMDTRGHGSG